VNFAPAEAPAPAFSPGEIIPASRIALPIETADLLSRVNGLVASLPREQLSSTIDGLNKAFGNTGPDLQNLLDSARRLQDEATRNLGPTQQLINDLGPVLATQNAGSGDIGSYTGNLAAVTQQLVGSDTDIRGSIDKFPQAATQADKLLNGLRPTVPMLLANLTSVGQVTRVYIPHIAQTLTLLQPVTNQIISTLQSSPTPDAIKINFETVINDPPPCVTGFVQQRRSPADLSPSKPGTNANCKEPANSPILVRGSRNDPCPPASPLPEGRANSESGCGLNFQSPAQAAAVSTAAIRTQLDAEAQVVASAATSPNKGRPNNAPQAAAGQSGAPAPTTDYDSSSGVFMAPGTAQPEVFGNALSQNGRDWRSLLLNPLGVGTP
jgi:phospholipid/cholesterol/gamma-HCH transport system substrate-binding protein